MTEGQQLFQCRLCCNIYPNSEMSEEHYPAKNTGNEDVVAFDILKFFDMFTEKKYKLEITDRVKKGETLEHISDELFDTRISKPLYPAGRTARTLCRRCNTFLGKYDEAYLKFYNCDGNSKSVKGFRNVTKHQTIKAIYAKFLSVPEAQNETFDFVDFIRDEACFEYNGKWLLYFVRRNYSTDMLGFADIATGKVDFEEGVVYEMSDDKFIYNLMNFPKHECYEMTNIFEILNKNYRLVEGVGKNGGYHSQIFMTNMFQQVDF